MSRTTILKQLGAFTLFLCLFNIAVNAEGLGKSKKKDTTASAAPQKGDVYFSPVPVFGVNPAFGFIYGAGATTSMFLGDPQNTHLSNVLAGLAYTTKSQLIFTVKSSVYTDKDGFILLGDWRYLNSSQPTFGIGTGPESRHLSSNGFSFDDNTFSKPLSTAQMMSFKFLRFYETALKNIGDGFYVGMGYHLDYYSSVDDKMLDLTDSTITSYYAYNVKNGFAQDRNVLSGISVDGIYDTRDNQNNPYKGRYAFVSFKYNPTFLGSTKSSSTLWMEYRDYFDLKKNKDHHNILGVWAFGNFNTSGTLPYMDLPALGWDQFAKSGRGYVQGRFRGQNLVYSEVEFRKHLFASKKNPDFMGMVVFCNMTTASSTSNNINLFQYIEPGYGAGLRFMLSKKARSNIALDYGMGKYGSSGIYIRLNETF